MSDPVTNVEIEDVLSSIRRLVSNGKQGRGAKPAEPQSDLPPEERLVLTPALRVDDSTPTADHDSFVWKDMLEDAKSDAPVGETTPEPAPEPAEQHPESGALFHSKRTPLSRGGQPAGEGPAEEDSPRARDAAPSGLEAQAAEFEAAVASRDDQWEPDGITDDALAGRPVPTLDWRDVEEDAEAAIPADAPTAEPDWVIPEWSSSSARAATAPREDRQDTATPSEGESPDEAHAARADARASDAPQGLSIDDSLLDEESLRDLVAEIVREELQGALGERITRNVRKLVRREIHRALTSQDFD